MCEFYGYASLACECLYIVSRFRRFTVLKQNGSNLTSEQSDQKERIKSVQSSQLLHIYKVGQTNYTLYCLSTNCATVCANKACFISKGISVLFCHAQSGLKQGVALTGRNTTGPPGSVGRPTAHAPAAGAPTDHAPGGPPARTPAALQTTTNDR